MYYVYYDIILFLINFIIGFRIHPYIYKHIPVYINIYAKRPNNRLFGNRDFHIRSIYFYVFVVYEKIDQPIFVSIFDFEYGFIVLVKCVQICHCSFAVRPILGERRSSARAEAFEYYPEMVYHLRIKYCFLFLPPIYYQIAENNTKS